jgi:hypothetical protein
MKKIKLIMGAMALALTVSQATAQTQQPMFTYNEARGTFMVQYVPDGRTVQTAPIYCRFYIGKWVWWDHARRNHKKYPLPFDWTQEYSDHMCKLIAVWKNIHP